MSKEPIIEVSDLSKHYLLNRHAGPKSDTLYGSVLGAVKGLRQLGRARETEEFWALKDVSFSVQRGDRVGVIGRNGAGKSTLLKILSRITPPTSGHIQYSGRMASLLEVGTGFHGDLSGRENIYLNGSILGMNKQEIDKKFDEIVAFSEVERFLDTPVKRYSSGMYVRLAFSVAAHLDPEILIVDEVLAVGDAAFQKKCLGKMNEVSKSEGRTILFVSHNMQAIQKLCNKGLYLNKGRMHSYGDIDDIVGHYLQSGEASQAEFTLPLPETESFGYAHTVFIEDLQGRPLVEIPVGDDWRARILFRILKPTPHFIVGFGIVSLFEQPIRTSWSAPEDFQPGDYEIIFENTDLMLTTGVYTVVIGLSSEQKTFQYVDKTVSLSISDAGDTSHNKRIVNTQSGLILNPMPVSLRKL